MTNTDSPDPFGERHDHQTESDNPYAATALESGIASSATDENEFERIRRRHLSHEASIKAIALLYYMGAAICLLTGTMLILALTTQGNVISAGIGILPFGIVFGVVGFGLRGLRPWARPFTILLSTVGLLGFPVGTLISAYMLYLMLSPKGRLVLSAEYAEIVESTPHIFYRTSAIVWFFLILLLIVLAIGMVGLMFVG